MDASTGAVVQAVRTLVDRPGDLQQGEEQDLQLVVDLIHARLALRRGDTRRHVLVPPLALPGSASASNQDVEELKDPGEAGPPEAQAHDLASDIRNLQQLVHDMKDRIECLEGRMVPSPSAAVTRNVASCSSSIRDTQTSSQE